MSMNLFFRVKGGAGHVDFPFQTPTTLSRAVLKETDKTKRLELIEQYLSQFDEQTAREMLQEVRELFANPNLILDMM